MAHSKLGLAKGGVNCGTDSYAVLLVLLVFFFFFASACSLFFPYLFQHLKMSLE